MLFTVWPALIVAHYTGVEPFELPPNAEVWRGIVMNALFDVLFNGCLIVGISDSSAIIMSAGTQFAVPVSFIVDVIVNGYTVTAGAVLGALLLCVGFVALQKSRADDTAEGRKSFLHASFLAVPEASTGHVSLEELDDAGYDGDGYRRMASMELDAGSPNAARLRDLA